MEHAIDAHAAKYSDAAILIGRILIGALMLIAAYNKMKGYAGAGTYFTRLGIPAPSVTVPLTILFEAAAGILLIIGYQTRIVALAVAAFCVLLRRDGADRPHQYRRRQPVQSSAEKPGRRRRVPGAVRGRSWQTVARRQAELVVRF